MNFYEFLFLSYIFELYLDLVFCFQFTPYNDDLYSFISHNIINKLYFKTRNYNYITNQFGTRFCDAQSKIITKKKK